MRSLEEMDVLLTSINTRLDRLERVALNLGYCIKAVWVVVGPICAGALIRYWMER